MFGKRRCGQPAAKSRALTPAPTAQPHDGGSSLLAIPSKGAAPRPPAPSQPGLAAPTRARPGNGQNGDSGASCSASKEVVETSNTRVQPLVMQRIDVGKASTLLRPEFEAQIADIVAEILVEEKLQLNQLEQRELVMTLLDDMLSKLLESGQREQVVLPCPGQVLQVDHGRQVLGQGK